MSEKFSFDVSFAATFDQLQTLRRKMIEFLESERRDFQPVFDVAVVGVSHHFLLDLFMNH
jgi:hypothetical protein